MIARTTHGPDDPGRSLSAAYVLELRRQIREDAYRSTEVVDEIARSVLRSGDLWN